MRKIILALVLFLLPFSWAFSEEMSFTLCEGITGNFTCTKDWQVTVNVLQQLDGQHVKKLTIFYSTGHHWNVNLKLAHEPVSGIGKFNQLTVDQFCEGGSPQFPSGAFTEYFVFQDRKCLGPPAKMIPIKDTILLAKANRLAHKIGEFFRGDCTKDPQKIASAVMEALALPTRPMGRGEFLVSSEISGYWSHQVTRDGILETLRFESKKLSWSIHYSTWNRGPAMDKSGLVIQLVWKDSSPQATFTLSKKKDGRIKMTCSVLGELTGEGILPLIGVSEALLEHFQENGVQMDGDVVPSTLKEMLIKQMQLSVESYVVAD